MQQQVNVQAEITLTLPAEWGAEQISDFLRLQFGQAFYGHLSAPENVSPVNFDFQEEAEIYGIVTRGDLLDALKEAISALNQTPSFPISHVKHRNSYQLIPDLERIRRNAECLP